MAGCPARIARPQSDLACDTFRRAAFARTADVSNMAQQYGCEVVVIVPQDKAWTNDPFAASADYRLAENRDARWRIYVRRK